MKLKTIFTILSISLLFASCAVSEDFVLKKNKGVDYKLSIDASQMLSVLNSPAGSVSDEPLFSTSEKMDTFIRVIDMVRQEADSAMLEGMDADLKNIEPLYYEAKADLNNGVFAIELYGSFKDADAFNAAMSSLVRLESIKGKKESGSEKKDAAKKELLTLINGGRLSWNGKVAEYVIGVNSEEAKIDSYLEEPSTDEEDLDFDSQLNKDLDDLNESMETLGAMTRNSLGAFAKEMKITTIFHLPKEVKSVDLPEAGIFDNGKTVKIEHSRGQNISADNNKKMKITVK